MHIMPEVQMLSEKKSAIAHLRSVRRASGLVLTAHSDIIGLWACSNDW
jgi:hypothetical protein